MVSAKETVASVEHALSSYTWPDGVRYQVYLQGSYKNSTNIRGDSDVDVVVQLNSCFYSNLSEEQKRRRALSDGRYTFADFRSLVSDALVRHYGRSSVADGNKCLKVARTHLPADVVACVQYRNYFNPEHSNSYAEGMTFWTRDYPRQVVNYPKVHYENGVNKHQATNNYFKPTVRMFKNIRTHLEDTGAISGESVPSYFLECLIYNVPTDKFSYGSQETFCNVVNWLCSANLSSLCCQNGQLLLFGSTPEQWQTSAAEQFLAGAVHLWESFA